MWTSGRVRVSWDQGLRWPHISVGFASRDPPEEDALEPLAGQGQRSHNETGQSALLQRLTAQE